MKPGEPLPPSRTLAKQTGFRRNAVTTAYERLIADGFAVATVGSGTFVAARIPARVNGAPEDEDSSSRRRSKARCRSAARTSMTGPCSASDPLPGGGCAHSGPSTSLRRSAGQPRTSVCDRRSFAVGTGAALRSRADHADIGNAARLADRAERHSQARRSDLVRGSRLSCRAKCDRALWPSPRPGAGRRIRPARGQRPGSSRRPHARPM